MILPRILFLTNSQEPRPAISQSSILLPCAEVVTAYGRFPTGSPDWKVGLPSEELFGFAGKTVT
jgi:hypothetical protein